MPRFKLTIEYNGTRYSGWQIQTNARTIQGELVKAVRTATSRERFEVYGAGRTDAGVHALAQVAHLDVGTPLPPATLAARVNEALPNDIHVRRIEVVPHRFHARHDATARGYLYQISRRRTAFAKPFVWWVRDPLDVARMRAGAAGFAGMRDFASFTDDDPDEKSTTVAIASVTVEEAGALVLVRVVGSHFLWKMVRRMVGLLVAVGTGELEPREIGRALTSRSDLPAKLTAPASGLFLEFVAYGGEAGVPQVAPFGID
jgi:tRNA pseudouridine38-40 synthase